MNPTKNEIAAPAALYGIHFVSAIRGRSTALLSAIKQHARQRYLNHSGFASVPIPSRCGSAIVCLRAYMSLRLNR
jgi:hypothetical protein